MWCFTITSVRTWWDHDTLYSQTAQRNSAGEFGTLDVEYNFYHSLFNLLWYLAEPASAFWTLFGGEQSSIVSARSICQFNMVAEICICILYIKLFTVGNKNINIGIITGSNFFSPWFPVFLFWISWMTEGQKICISDYKLVKTESGRCFLRE